MTTKNFSTVFDYRALRLLAGLIAFALPFVVRILSSSPLPSISASYYTEAHDAFVGMLFVVSAFLWAYNGHTSKEALASKVASLAAIFVAIFPTPCDSCKTNIKSIIHYFSAVTFFAILAYFCFVPFRRKTKGKGGKKGLRSKIYFICGWIIVICLLSAGIMNLTIPEDTIKTLSINYFAGAIALAAFGIAWNVAGKFLSPFVDKDEMLRLFGQ